MRACRLSSTEAERRATTNTIFEPFAFAFFRDALTVATVAGGLCGLVGVFVVLRGMSYIGHGLSHAIFGGAVASYVVGINFYVGAGVWGVVSALMIQTVARRRTVGADAAIGVVTTASFALGIAIISRAGGFTRNFEAALFGNVLAVTPAQIGAVIAVTVVVVAIVYVWYRKLLFTTFDPEVAEVMGVSTLVIDSTLALILAATITVSMTVLGVTMVAAALVIPAVSARLLTDSFGHMIRLSTVLGALCGATGVYLSYYLDISSGSAVVLCGAAVFTFAFVSSRRPRTSGSGRRSSSLPPASGAEAPDRKVGEVGLEAGSARQ